MEHYGIISLLPPILAIGLAIRTRNVLFSIFVGLFVGILALSGYNPVLAFSKIIPEYIYVQVGEDYQVQSLTNLMIIGGFVTIIGATGGAAAFANSMRRLINSKVKTEVSMWLGGLFVWFSDSANSLIIGPIFQPLGDVYKVSREKFAYILDATSSPICALIPIISWGVYIMGLIEKELVAMPNTNHTPWSIFVSAVPFQFYSILTLLMVGYLAITQFDYGPMYKAQLRALSGKLLNDGAIPLRNTNDQEMPSGVEAKAVTVVLPIVSVLIVMFTIFIMNGFPQEKLAGGVIRTGISLGFITGALIAVALSVKYKIFSLKDAEKYAFDGMKDMMYLVVLMIFSWSLGTVCKQLGTSNYIIQATESFLNPGFLPAILFFVASIMSLATGSSWGPYAILMPIGLPMAMAVGSPIPVTVAAIISGGLFGDHCSPLSDTTLLASMGAASDHMDHFRTQFPYALTAAGVSLVLYVIAGFGSSPIILVPGILSLFAVIFVLHKASVRKAQAEANAQQNNEVIGNHNVI